MPNTLAGIAIIIFLSPGILGYFVYSKVYCNKVPGNFDKIALIFAFNALSFLTYYAVDSTYIFDLLELQIVKAVDLQRFLFRAGFPLIALSSIIAFSLAYVMNTNRIQTFLREQGFTSVSGYSSVLTDVIKEHPDSYFRIRFRDGSSAIGHPQRYSLYGDEEFLYLGNAAFRLAASGSAVKSKIREVRGSGILLLGFEDVMFVEILDGIE